MGIWTPGPGPTASDDTYEGDPGADVVDGGAGNDTLHGNDGNDVLSGGAGNDTLDGGEGDDRLNGGDDDDFILGGEGNDIISAGSGVDRAQGEAGNDLFVLTSVSFGFADSQYDGGSGFDTFDYSIAGSPLFFAASSGAPGTFTVADNVVAGVERILSGSGNDTFFFSAFGGPIEIFAGGGNDSLSNVSGVLHGGAGNDSFTSSAPGSQMLGEDGDDQFFISGSFGVVVPATTVSGGTGNDLLQTNIQFAIDLLAGTAQSGSASFAISSIERVQVAAWFGYLSTVKGGNAGEDLSVNPLFNDGSVGVVFEGGGGSDTLTGSIGNDTLSGDSGDDSIAGAAGNDSLSGGAGSDMLSGGLGDDALDGGEGLDTASYADAVQGVTVQLGIAQPQDTRSAGFDLLAGIENLTGSGFDDSLGGDAEDNVIAGGGGADAISGRAGHNILDGGSGNDWLFADEGSDTLIGGTGSDVVDYSHATGGVTASLAIAGPQDTGAAGVDTLSSIENLWGSFDFDDVLIGDDNPNLIYGFGGDDTLIGAGGNDTFRAGSGFNTIDGGDGSDQIEYIESNVGVHVDLRIVGPQDTGMSVDTLTGIETAWGSEHDDILILGDDGGVLIGNGGDDILQGGTGTETLDGRDGDDTLIGGDGLDYIYGAAGNDTASYRTAQTGVAVSLALSGQFQNTLGAGDDFLADIENLVGSGFNDTLTGDSGANALEGGAGNDTLNGAGGIDTASYASAFAGVTVSLGVATLQNTFGAGFDRLVAIENLTGSAFADTLTGDASANVLLSGDGNDTLIGGLGNDTLDGGDGVDTASYATATSGVSVNLSILSAQNTFSAGSDILTNIENLIGSAFGDVLTGDGGNNTLFGGAGVDTLNGGAGDDILNGGDNSDFITDLAGVVAIDGGIGNDQITLGAGVLTGTVDGGEGSDQLTKGGSIAGLVISNIEILNTNGGTVTATAAQLEAFDTIRYSVSQPFTAVSLALAAAGTVDLADELTGRRAIFAGTSGVDVITTSTGSDQIDGGDGNDILTGNAGNDTLIGGLGDDVLNGGEGTDFLVELSGVVAVDGGDGDDVITLGAALNSGTVAGGLGTDQLNKGGAIAGLTITGVEIVNTNGGTLLATAAQLEGFDTIRFSAAQATTAVSLALSAAGSVDLVDELLGRRALFAGSTGDDTITTSNGSDQIDGGDGNDVLTGNAGVDTLIGGLGDDVLNGGDGNDFLVDLSGRVVIDGGDGDDVITVGALAGGSSAVSPGTITGGLGVDQLNKSGVLGTVVVSGVEILNTNGGTLSANAQQLESFDTIRFSAAQSTALVSLILDTSQHGVPLGGTFDLADELLGRRATIVGSGGADVVITSDGADRIDGAAGDDTLNGGLGNDTLLGGAGNDLIIQGSADGRDFIDGGAGTDTYQLNGTAAAETFRIMTRAEAVLAGITGLAGSTEIVITRNGTDTASVIAELDNVEEIQVNTLLTTADNGNGTVDGGADSGDTIIVTGNFTTTSLAYSTIHVAGSSANDTVDISGLSSAHRIVFDTNGGSDNVIGTLRPQDVVNTPASLASDPVLLQMILGEDAVAKPDFLHDPGLVSPVETFGLDAVQDRGEADLHRAQVVEHGLI